MKREREDEGCHGDGQMACGRLLWVKRKSHTIGTIEEEGASCQVKIRFAGRVVSIPWRGKPSGNEEVLFW